MVADSAEIDDISVIGDGAVIGAGSQIIESIIWEGAQVDAGAKLERAVVTGTKAGGDLKGEGPVKDL